MFKEGAPRTQPRREKCLFLHSFSKAEVGNPSSRRLCVVIAASRDGAPAEPPVPPAPPSTAHLLGVRPRAAALPLAGRRECATWLSDAFTGSCQELDIYREALEVILGFSLVSDPHFLADSVANVILSSTSSQRSQLRLTD